MPGQLATLVRAKYPGAYDDMDDAALEAAVLKAHPQYADLAREAMPTKAALATDAGGSGGGMAMAGLKGLLPLARQGIEGLATSPTLPKTMGSVARGLTTVGAIGHGLYTGSPTEILAAPMEGWAAGKGGYFLGKGAQSLAGSAASGLEKIAPLMGPMSGAAGVGDLAQMAEPNRKDIGFMGIGATQHVPGEKPALINSLLSKFVKIGPET